MTARLHGVRLAGVASAVPAQAVTADETGAAMGMTVKEIQKVAKLTGVQRRHIAPAGMCTSDIAELAANRLLADLQWDPKSVRTLVMVTQTPDYDLPATACLLQDRLDLSTECAAVDVSLGCSGYVYGLWLCAGMIAAGSVDRALLLVGETLSLLVSPQDRGTAFLFGDGAAATALEKDGHAPPMDFVLETDGKGKDSLIVPAGGYRNPVTADSIERRPDAEGRLRRPLDLYMDGAEVLRFTLERVPSLVEKLLAVSGWTMDQLDAFVPHQANRFMLHLLIEQSKIPPEKLVLSLEEFGNTSSASIPLTLTHGLAPRLRQETMRLLLAGFGVGWSWGAVSVTCGPMVMSDLVLAVPAEAAPAA
ncbi:MAG: ketoacyl-ACP synthase III [Bryobacterales bacterium]|nr:ketoacyl-ACP synthase III [Bryobacterales bacterium]